MDTVRLEARSRADYDEIDHEIDREDQDVDEGVRRGLTKGEPCWTSSWEASARVPAQVEAVGHPVLGPEEADASQQHFPLTVAAEATVQGVCGYDTARAEDTRASNVGLREDLCPDRVLYREDQDATTFGDTNHEADQHPVPQGYPGCQLWYEEVHCLAVHQGRRPLLPCTLLRHDAACVHAPSHYADGTLKREAEARIRMGAHVDAKEGGNQALLLLRDRAATSGSCTAAAGSGLIGRRDSGSVFSNQEEQATKGEVRTLAADQEDLILKAPEVVGLWRR